MVITYEGMIDRHITVKSIPSLGGESMDHHVLCFSQKDVCYNGSSTQGAFDCLSSLSPSDVSIYS